MSGSIRFTPTDVAVLRFLGRQRFATAPQLARWARRSEKKLYPRLCGLRAASLVDFRRPFIERGVYLATRAGLELAGLDLPAPRVDIRTFAHDRLVAGLAVDLERAGALVVSEREMRHADESAADLGAGENGGRPRYAVTLPGAGRHYPDLAVVRETGRIEAIEVELTHKAKARLEAILAGYGRARHVGRVTYHVGDPRLGDKVARLAARMGLADLVGVLAWEEP